MKKHANDHNFTPWEYHPHFEDTIERLQDLQNPKTIIKPQEQIKPTIVHSVQVSINKNQAKIRETTQKHNQIEHYIAELQDRAIKQKAVEQKEHTHHQNKKIEVYVKPIPKNDINVVIPQEALLHPKVSIQRPIKHTIKTNRELQSELERHEARDIKSQAQGNIRQATRKMSVDLLHKSTKAATNPSKKSNEYDDLVIKKCHLKNINFSGGQDKKTSNEKALPKPQGAKIQKGPNSKHLLDRLLSKLD